MLLALDPATQWENCYGAIRLLTKGILAESAFAQLEVLCRAGEVSAADLARKLGGLIGKSERSAFIHAFAKEHALNTVDDSRRAIRANAGL